MGAGDLALFLQHLDDEGGGREGEGEAREQVYPPAGLEEMQIKGDDAAGQQNLQGAQPEHGTPQGPEATWVHLQADDEEEQHHPQLGEVAHILDMFGNRGPRRMGANEDARHQETQNRAEPKPAEDGDGQGGSQQQDDGGIDEGFGFQGAMLRVLGRSM
jgi:hypothetical protein